jgi:hypothetical protein
MKYSIQFLDNEQFDSLPYPDMAESLGVADPVTKNAYVRRTGIPSLDLFNAAHELEHLEDGHEGVHADHYENGVYYKKARDFIQSAAPLAPLAFLIPGIGPALGGALSSIGGALAGGLGAIPGIGGALGGAASSIGGGIGSALGIGGSSAAGGAMSQGASKLGMLGPNVNAGRLGAGQMIGGQASYAAAPNVIGKGIGALGAASKGGTSQLGNTIQSVASNLSDGMFTNSPMQQFMPQEQGSYEPQVSNSPNTIPGGSGTGSLGGPGGSPGSVGGGTVSKLKPFLQQYGGNQDYRAGGNL